MPIKQAELFFKILPHEYMNDRLIIEIRGDLDTTIKSFRRSGNFIKPKHLTISDGKVSFSKTQKTLTFLYGCVSLDLRNVRLKLQETTERLSEITH